MGGDDTVVGSAVRDVVEGEGRGIVREELLDVVKRVHGSEQILDA